MAEFENRPFGQNAQPEERAKASQSRGMQQGARSDEKQESQEHSEGRVARAIEDKTARAPSDWFLWASLGAMAAAAVIQLREQKQWSLFLGQWAAPLLLFGVYNKLVKVAGSDRTQGDGSMDRAARAY
jgi:hypothetical protein